MQLTESHVRSATWLFGLPAGLALSSSLGTALGHLAAPSLWSLATKIPLLDPTPEGVAATATAVASVVAPAALLPVLRLYQKSGIVPGWASAPVGLSMAVAGIGHYVHAIRSLLSAGVALPLAIDHVGVGAVMGTLAAMMAGGWVALPRNKRGKQRDPDGPWQADWWAMKDARRFLSQKNGLILGEACVPKDEPEKMGLAPLLRWLPLGHLLTVAGSGAGKGVSVVVPNCLGWSGPLVVHDPAGETLAIVRPHREALGRTVRVVSLDADTDGVNVLAGLNPTDKQFYRNVRTVVSWMDPGEKGGAEQDGSFGGLAKTLATALIMFVLTSDTIPDHERHLLKVRQLGASPNLTELLKTMVGMRDVARGAMSNAAGMVLTTMKSDETFAGVAMHFDELTSCIEGAEEILCGDVAPEKRFALSDILRGDMDLFISIPADTLVSEPQKARILLGALAMQFMQRKERAEHDTLFIVDEMPLLGRMEILSIARDFARKFGLYLWAIAQDLGQLEEAYKKTGMRSWLATPAVFQVFGVNDLETAEMLSKRIDDYTAIQQTESKSKGHSRSAGTGSTSNTKSENVQATRAAVLPVSEIMSLTVDDKGIPEEQLLFIRGRRPLRCGLAKYYRRPEMAGLVKANPFYQAPPSAPRQWHKFRHEAAAMVYGSVLGALSLISVISPLPLTAGDEAVIVGGQAVPVYWVGGNQAGAFPPGWPVRVVSMNRRMDGFVEVAGYGARGEVLQVLVHGDSLGRR